MRACTPTDQLTLVRLLPGGAGDALRVALLGRHRRARDLLVLLPLIGADAESDFRLIVWLIRNLLST